MQPYAQCNNCKHITKKTGNVIYYCTAYLDGVPAEIALNIVDHKKPFPGDHGIQFEAKPKKSWKGFY